LVKNFKIGQKIENWSRISKLVKKLKIGQEFQNCS